MRQLFTKDGARTGNAIIIREIDLQEVRTYSAAFADHLSTANQKLYLVETDFGNRMRMTTNEVNEQFTYGEEMDYAAWDADRRSLREHNHIEDNPDEHLIGPSFIPTWENPDGPTAA